eukprot:COSAG01_NODE_676_length_14324_cov_17.420105_3_plen_72_part_00
MPRRRSASTCFSTVFPFNKKKVNVISLTDCDHRATALEHGAHEKEDWQLLLKWVITVFIGTIIMFSRESGK